MPRITVEQWRALIAVVDGGTYAGAAELLHKTQSSISYAVSKIERQLDLRLFEVQGRKAVLTHAGEALCRRARTLIEEAARVERAAGHLAAGWEAELRLAVEIIFPTWRLLQCLKAFAAERPDTQLELYESVLGGTDELLLQGAVDLAVCSHVPAGFLGDLLMPVNFIAVAARRASSAPARPVADGERPPPSSPPAGSRFRHPPDARCRLAGRRDPLDPDRQGNGDPRSLHGPGVRLVSGGSRPGRADVGTTAASAARERGTARWRLVPGALGPGCGRTGRLAELLRTAATSSSCSDDEQQTTSAITGSERAP